jgi:hypothetical protein
MSSKVAVLLVIRSCFVGCRRSQRPPEQEATLNDKNERTTAKDQEQQDDDVCTCLSTAMRPPEASGPSRRGSFSCTIQFAARHSAAPPLAARQAAGAPVPAPEVAALDSESEAGEAEAEEDAEEEARVGEDAVEEAAAGSARANSNSMRALTCAATAARWKYSPCLADGTKKEGETCAVNHE